MIIFFFFILISHKSNNQIFKLKGDTNLERKMILKIPTIHITRTIPQFTSLILKLRKKIIIQLIIL